MNQAIYQYGIIAWGSASKNAIKPLNMHQNKVICICLHKNNFDGSTKINYKEFGVLPANLLIKIIDIIKK